MRRVRQSYFYLILIFPALFLVFGISLFPSCYTFYLSFRNESFRRLVSNFVGLSNYIQLSKDIYFWHSLRVTIIYVIAALVLRFFFGLGLALLFTKKTKGQSIPRIAILLPWVLNEIVVSAIWLWILDRHTGLLNVTLEALRMPTYGWLAGLRLALFSIIMVSFWRNLAFSVLLFLAALQNIPIQLYEAAKIDGAGSFSCLQHITIPLIKQTLMVVIIMITISNFGQFSLAYSMTGGGPERATELIGLYMYRESFIFLNISYGATIGVVIFIINMILTLSYYLGLRTKALY